jgi:hypothetical protein
MSKEEKPVNDNGQQGGLSLVIENFSEEMAIILATDQKESHGKSALMQLIVAICSTLREEDLASTRLVITGDLVTSVNSREDRTNKKFTMERGAGVVAAKTMPSNSDGIVDILVPSNWVLPLDDEQAAKERDAYLEHIAAHEAVHASIFHIGDEPFDLHHRKEFGYAMKNFVSMASEQIEEHLAEFIGSKTTGRKLKQTAGQVDAMIKTWQRTLSTELPAIPESSPDYFQQGMIVTFEALHILWKSLAYLAAALRTEDDSFGSVPPEIANLSEWQEFIAPWWPKYLELLKKIPMTVEVNIQATDEIVHEMAILLQSWANDIGFDFHDTEQDAYFRIKIWD